MFEYADAAVEAALGAGARYADARVMDRRHESMNARNGEIEGLTQEGSVGIGVRALIGSGWGFFSTADLDLEVARTAGAQAAAIARASASVPGADLELTPVEARTDHWENPVDEDPLSVPLAEKPRARTLLQEAAEIVSRGGADVLVRINRPLRLAIPDIEASVSSRVHALALPKVESANHLRLLCDEREHDRKGTHGEPPRVGARGPSAARRRA